ncbi:hypothetical protein EHQ16_03135 [Leptospira kanakyensis]|uniref:Uncharacterized protein n=1 Tax=Leptospira kanakyensis TaxID=2484968 RepID=A0A6N4PTA1_9LEPT|nr:hypothetical protein [Leptospira kanakyensis]TGK47536.1 hypothetical protein EHQ11_16495 [Leptospira kanakyensis]TGK63461.1 hypothetical protein EHQ16_03135 [Leptospira kanakyensis]TGK67064.1 hypothetical protein EHQ18_18370 [Leptospira kanakyensis]
MSELLDEFNASYGIVSQLVGTSAARAGKHPMEVALGELSLMYMFLRKLGINTEFDEYKNEAIIEAKVKGKEYYEQKRKEQQNLQG